MASLCLHTHSRKAATWSRLGALSTHCRVEIVASFASFINPNPLPTRTREGCLVSNRRDATRTKLHYSTHAWLSLLALVATIRRDATRTSLHYAAYGWLSLPLVDTMLQYIYNDASASRAILGRWPYTPPGWTHSLGFRVRDIYFSVRLRPL